MGRWGVLLARGIIFTLGAATVVVELGIVVFRRVSFDPLVLGVGAVMLGVVVPTGSIADVWMQKFPRRNGKHDGD